MFPVTHLPTLGWIFRLALICSLNSWFFRTVAEAETAETQTTTSHQWQVESGLATQSRNDQGIPGDSGTRFSLSNINRGPFLGARVYYSFFSDQQTQWRVLIAPLSLNLTGRLPTDTQFQNTVFAANTETQFLYRFNSYRLTWAHHFPSESPWKWALGLTGKIRDAEVRLEQNGQSESKTDLGFVPLLHAQARFEPHPLGWGLQFDFDGWAVSQGRAFDILLATHYRFDNLNQIYLGYRVIEGGADIKAVYNFALFQAWVVGATWQL